MLSTPETLSKVHNSRPAFDWMSMVVAVILVAMLFPTPQPNVQSNQPWRMELLTSLLLLATMIFEYLRDPKGFVRIFVFGSGHFGWIFGLLSAFTLWGLASSAWAKAPFSAWHHTVIWVNYLIAFLYLRYRIQKNDGTAFITSTFFWLALILGSLSLVDYSTSPNFAAVESNIRLRYSKYAELLITALPVLWVTSIYLRQNLGRRLFLLAASIGWLAVMLSLSRGAFIVGVFALAATFGAIILMGPVSIRKRTAKTAALWITLTLVVQFGFSYLSPIPSTSEYISGTSGQGSESSLARVFIWTIGGQMVRDNAILGVGADNFGVAFNRSRAAYRDANPSIPPDERVSDKTIERSHNEFLQIFAELGFVGLVLFGAAFVVVALWIVQTFRRRTSTFSPILISSIAGMAAFLASAGVSSFSFRLAQNGMVFFAVFAFATIELAKFQNGHSADQEPRRKPSSIVLFFLIASYLLNASVTMGLKGLAEYYVLAANQEAESAQAIRLYRRAYTVDPDYSATYLFSSARSYADKDYLTAASDIRFAVDRGLGVVLTYAVLADSFEKAGDQASAESTLTESLRIFPRSVLLHIKYAIFLGSVGRETEAISQQNIAANIDRKQALGWEYLLKSGSVKAFLAARENSEIALPADLIPEAAVRHYLDDAPPNSK